MSELSDQETTLRCPVCRFDYVHPVKVEVAPVGKDQQRVMVDASGVDIDRADASSTRGVIITVTYAGECGHYWSIVQQFHKGSTLQRVVVLEPPADFEPPDTIWRD